MIVAEQSICEKGISIETGPPLLTRTTRQDLNEKTCNTCAALLQHGLAPLLARLALEDGQAVYERH